MKLAPYPLREEIDHGINRAEATHLISLRYEGHIPSPFKKGENKNPAITSQVKFGILVGPGNDAHVVCFSMGRKPKDGYEFLQRIRGVVDEIGISKLVGPGKPISEKELRDYKREENQSHRREEQAGKEAQGRMNELLPLLDFLGRTRKECDHSHRRTKAWCRKNEATFEYREGYAWPFVNGIYLSGGGCDCEVFMNSIQPKEEAQA